MAPPKLPPGKYKWIDRGIYARGVTRCPKYPDGVVYGISYYFQGRRRLETVGPSVTLAKSALAARTGEIAQGRYQLQSSRRLPRFPDFCTKYLEDYSKPNKRSWERDSWALKKAVEFFGNRRLDEVSTWDIERYRAARIEGGVSIATANRDVALLKSLFNCAVEWGALALSPAAKVKMKREQEKPFRVLSPDEEVRLLAECAPHLKPIVVVALQTALRHSELVSLTWGCVDMARREIVVPRAKGGRVRKVPLNQAAIAALEALPHRDGSVFLFKGKSVRWIDTAFRAAVKRAKIAHATPHALRHTCLTRLANNGTSPFVIQRIAGHQSLKTTLRYVHVEADLSHEAVAKLCRYSDEPSQEPSSGEQE